MNRNRLLLRIWGTFILIVLLCVVKNSQLYGTEKGTMTGVSVEQAQHDKVTVYVGGQNLPKPEIVEINKQKTILKWRNVVLPSTTWNRDYEGPLLLSINVMQKEGYIEMSVLHKTGLKLNLHKADGDKRSSSWCFTLQREGAEEQGSYRGKRQYHELQSGEGAFLPISEKMASEPVSLSLRDVLLPDAFRLFAEYWDMNLILDDSVPERKTTIILKEISASQAFFYLLRSNDLRFVALGDKTLWVGKKENLGEILGLTETKSFRLAYSDIASTAKMVKQATGVQKIVEDERLNTLYVTADREQLLKVERYVELIDRPGKQVMIEARIVEIADRASHEVASCLESIYKHWMLEYKGRGTPGRIGYSDSYSEGMFGEDITSLSGTVKKLDALISTLEKEEKGHILAEPSVITIEGTKARIQLVQKYPYVSTRDEAGNPTYVSEEVGPQLEITPFVGRDEIITIKLVIKTGEVVSWREGARGETYPETSTRQVETQVRVRDGEPFVIGGLFKELKRENQYKFPILGDIPILGSLFSTQYTEKEKNEVIIIVIPHILSIQT